VELMATDDDGLFERAGEQLTAEELRALDLERSENRRLRDVYLKAIAESDALTYVATHLKDGPPEKLEIRRDAVREYDPRKGSFEGTKLDAFVEWLYWIALMGLAVFVYAYLERADYI
jgi:hypothetical protein